MEVRPATARDADELRALLGELGYERSTVALREFLQQTGDTQVIVGEVDGRVVGCLALSIRQQFHQPVLTASIDAFVVEEGLRSSGLGHDLIEAACRAAQTAGAAFVEVHSNARRHGAHRFYEREGFLATSKYFRRDLVPARTTDSH